MFFACEFLFFIMFSFFIGFNLINLVSVRGVVGVRGYTFLFLMLNFVKVYENTCTSKNNFVTLHILNLRIRK